MQRAANDSISYEDALRVIGRHLDAEPAYFASILEVYDGYAVRFQSARHKIRVKTVEFSYEKLRDLEVFQLAARGSKPRRARHAGMCMAFPAGRQEFLRALGSMLDEARASSVTVDELAQEVRISYLRPVPQKPLQVEKVATVLHPDAIELLVAEARSRRGTSVAEARA